MIVERRPRIEDFGVLVGTEVSVGLAGGELSLRWPLVELEELDKAPLKELEGEDCFTLIFEVEERFEQDLYLIEGSDGVVFTLLAIPTMGSNGKVAMQVIVN